MPSDMVEKSSYLRQFTLCTMLAADILHQVNVSISPTAVANQIKQNKESALASDDLNAQICYSSGKNMYTLVQHCAGYHFDTFRHNKPKLENRVCLMNPVITSSIGRGGAGAEKFVWALLDW
jgi:hypothetical protein